MGNGIHMTMTVSGCRLMRLKVVHRVTPVFTGARYSITLYTPGKLDRLTAQDWDNLATEGVPNLLCMSHFQPRCDD